MVQIRKDFKEKILMRIFKVGKKRKVESKAESTVTTRPSANVPEQLKAAIDKNNIALQNLEKRHLFLEKKIQIVEEDARKCIKEKKTKRGTCPLKKKETNRSTS